MGGKANVWGKVWPGEKGESVYTFTHLWCKLLGPFMCHASPFVFRHCFDSRSWGFLGYVNSPSYFYFHGAFSAQVLRRLWSGETVSPWLAMLSVTLHALSEAISTIKMWFSIIFVRRVRLFFFLWLQGTANRDEDLICAPIADQFFPKKYNLFYDWGAAAKKTKKKPYKQTKTK